MKLKSNQFQEIIKEMKVHIKTFLDNISTKNRFIGIKERLNQYYNEKIMIFSTFYNIKKSLEVKLIHMKDNRERHLDQL